MKIFTINFIGNLFISEIISLILLPFISIKELFEKHKELVFVLKYLLYILIAQVLSDYVNTSSSSDFFRGWALFVFSGISVLSLTYLGSKDEKSLATEYTGKVDELLKKITDKK